jgi:hypothetical protein
MTPSPPGEPSHRTRGDGSDGAVPPARSWEERVDDPDEPLFTMAVAADLLGLDTQTLRRLSVAIDQGEARPSGNQRRYSRHDLERLATARTLTLEGHNAQSVAVILTLTDRLGPVSSSTPPG